MTPAPRELGDHIHAALASVGITPERVTDWLGFDCGCQRWRVRLNRLSTWAKRCLRGDPRGTMERLEEITSPVAIPKAE